MSATPASTKNPLTVIAIFAAIVEASALASLPFLKDDSQDLYTWFLIGFPPFLTLLFFVTLNFNYKVLYSPSDFSNENDFLEIAKGPIPSAEPATAAKPSPPEARPPVTPVPPAAAGPDTAPPPSPAQAPPRLEVRQDRINGDSRALYILDCQHFASDEQLNNRVNEILSPVPGLERQLIILYRETQLRSPVSSLLGHVLSKALEARLDCLISAYDLDKAELTTLARRYTHPPGRQAQAEP